MRIYALSRRRIFSAFGILANQLSFCYLKRIFNTIIRADVEQELRTLADILFSLQSLIEAFILSLTVEFKFIRMPVGIESGSNLSDGLRQITCGDLHIPFETTGNGRVGKIGGSDIGRSKTGITVEHIRLGMQAGALGIIGNLDLDIFQLGHFLDGFDICCTHVGGCDNTQLAAALGKFGQFLHNQAQAAPFDEGNQHIDAVGGGNFFFQFGEHLRLMDCSGKQAALCQRCFRTNNVFCGFAECDTGILFTDQHQQLLGAFIHSSDNEIQDPLKEAVKQILSSDDLQQQLAAIAEEVTQKLQEVSTRTLEKLREMAPDVADSLNPVIPAASALKWPDVFKGVSITGDNEIPINKRGSGVRRLVLLNFFRAEAERRMEAVPGRAVIYAIEEPETSQHTNNQKMLIKALIDLAAQRHTQVLITTHSSQVVKALGFDAIRILTSDDGIRRLGETNTQCLPTLSYNEVNYIAFHDVTEEYHNELFGYIEAHRQLQAYESGKPTMRYIEERNDGSLKPRQCTLTRYIRHQIHHPENTCNPHFSPAQLEQSIELMRQFILGSH